MVLRADILVSFGGQSVRGVVTQQGRRIEGTLPNFAGTGLVDVIVTYNKGKVIATLPNFFYFLPDL